MRSGTKTHYRLETTDARLAEATFGRILEAEGIRVLQGRRTDDGFELDGESDFPGLGILLIPVSLFTGHGLDVQVHVRGQRSLDPGDDRIHVWVHVTALHEWGHGVYAGLPHANVLQCGRMARRIASRFDEGGVLPADGAAAAAGPGADAPAPPPSGSRRRRGGRLLVMIEIGVVAAALLVWLGLTCSDTRPASGPAPGDSTGTETRPQAEEEAPAVEAREALRAEIARGARSPAEREALLGLLDRVHDSAWRMAYEQARDEQRPVELADYRRAVREASLGAAVDDPRLVIRFLAVLPSPD